MKKRYLSIVFAFFCIISLTFATPRVASASIFSDVFTHNTASVYSSVSQGITSFLNFLFSPKNSTSTVVISSPALSPVVQTQVSTTTVIHETTQQVIHEAPVVNNTYSSTGASVQYVQDAVNALNTQLTGEINNVELTSQKSRDNLATAIVENGGGGGGTSFSPSDARNAFSVDASSSLSYDPTLGVLGVIPGYTIPLTASTTNWNSFFQTPSTRIQTGVGLSWVGNILTVTATGTSQWTSNGGSIFYNVGNVGIGSTSPSAKLTVIGDALITGTTTATNFSGNFSGNGSGITGLTTSQVAEGSNLYYTDARAAAQADARISADASTIQGFFSSNATGLSYNSGTGVFSLTAGYNIPLTASTTNWNSFFNTPSTRISAGTGLSWAGNTLNFVGATGTVSSVGLSLPNIFNVSGSPVTSSGTLSATLASQGQNLILASPDGSSGVPTFRALAAGDVPILNQNTTGTAANITGVAAVANGGTGTSTAPALNQLLIGNGNGGYAYTSTSSLGLVTTNIAEGSNLYFTNARVDSRFATDLSNTTTDALPQGAVNKYYSDALSRNALLSNATGLSYNTSTGVFSLTAGYNIPLTASTTNWDSFYANPSTRITAGSGLSWAGNTLNFVGATGTVSSVGLSLPNIFNVSGSPVTSSGTLSATLASQGQNLILASPDGSSGVPTFRALAAGDVPILNQNTTGTAANITGVAAVANGGTGTSTAPALNQLLIGNGNGGYAYVSTSSLGIVGGVSTVFGRTGAVTAQTGDYTTSQITEGTNLYYTDARARNAISTNATGLTYTSSNGVFSLTAGYNIPLTASTTNWDSFYATPSTRITAGTGLSWVGTTLNYTGATGTVSSVGLSLPNIFNVSGSPVTSSGTLSATLASEGQNLILASPDGSSGPPTFRALAAGDVPVLNQNTTGTAGNITGVAGVTNGGTGTSTAPALNQILIGNGTGGYAYVSTSSLGIVGGVSTVFGRAGAVTAQTGDYTTSQVTEGTNLYFTNARADARIALATSTFQNFISSNATGLTYTPGTGIFSLTAGYNIPLTASTTNWDSFYATPSSRIIAGTGLSWSGNTLNASSASTTWLLSGSSTYYLAGNVGIGTTTPSQFLTIGNNNQFTIDGSGNATTTGSITSPVVNTNGWAVNNNNEVFYFEGSSITRGNTLPGAQLANGGLTGNFGYLLSQSSWGLNHGTYYNDGVNSNTSAQDLAQYTTGNSVYGVTVPSAHSLSPAVTGSTSRHFYFLDMTEVYNDISTGVTEASSTANLQNIVAAAQADGWYVVLLTNPTLYNSSTAGDQQMLDENQEARNGTIPSNMLLDMAKWLPDKTDTQYFTDGLHPNANGHRVIAANLIAAMISGGSQINYSGDLTNDPYIFNNGLTTKTSLNGNALNVTGSILQGAGTASFSNSAVSNVLYIKNTNSSGWSTEEFDNSGGTQEMTLGYGNSSAGILPGLAYLYTSNASTPLTFGTAGTERMRISGTGLVGIGSTTPSSLLSVRGSAGATSSLFTIASSSNAVDLTVLANGNVGIGTTTPNQNLTIAGNEYLTGQLLDSTNAGGTLGQVLLATGTSTRWVATSTLGITSGSGSTPGGNNGAIQFNNSGTLGGTSTLSWDNTNYFLGIGTSTPTQKLSVVGNEYLSGAFLDSTNATGTLGQILLSTGTSTQWVATSSLGISGSAGLTPSGITGALQFNNGGNFAGSSTLFWDNTNGLLGIGTSTPSQLLTLYAQDVTTSLISATAPSLAIINGTSSVNSNIADLAFKTVDTNGTTVLGTKIASVFTNHTPGAVSGDLAFVTRNAGTLGERMRLSAAGNLGIGTTTPIALLDVNGNALLEGSNRYLNFGYATGTNGYGFFDNAGTLQYKNSGGTWTAFPTGSSATPGGLTTGSIQFNSSGTFSGSSTFLWDNTNGRLGIGSTTPTSMLSIQGFSGSSQSLFTVATSTSVSLFNIASTGNVTIGTSTSYGKFTVINSNSAVTTPIPAGNWAGTVVDATSFSSDNGLFVGSSFASSANTIFEAAGFNAGAITPILKITGDNHVSILAGGLYDQGSPIQLTVSSQNATDAMISNIWGSNVNPGVTIASTQGGNISPILRVAKGAVYNGSNLPTSSGTAVFTVLANGQIGIGTTSPSAFVSIHNNTGGAGTSSLFMIASSTTANLATTTMFDVLGNGNVGIGTTTPGNTLVVVGSACFSQGTGATTGCTPTAGNVTAVAFNTVTTVDVAENFPTSDLTISAGDVVSVDTNNDVSVVKATKGSSVLGIVSTAPGILLGSSAISSRPVALAGRVPVKFSNENGDITRGESLTISSTAGVAAKALPGDPVIGIALSNASNGEVMIFVGGGNASLASASALSGPQDSSTLLTNFQNLLTGTTQWASVAMNSTTGFFKNIFADVITANKAIFGNATVGSPSAPTGITLYDTITHAPYCLQIVNGVPATAAGVCGSFIATPSPVDSPSNTNVSDNTSPTTTDATDTSTTTADVSYASSTPDTSITTSSTTTEAIATSSDTIMPTPPEATTTNSSGSDSGTSTVSDIDASSTTASN